MKGGLNSNTTNVKVKRNGHDEDEYKEDIQIQPMLRLNSKSGGLKPKKITIQIQPMLRLNISALGI